MSATAKHLSADVPRYTSYPTAASFTDAVGPERHRAWLADTPEGEDLSLYVHIPYCAQLCWYCGCHARVANDDGPVRRYLIRLERELALLAEILPKRSAAAHVHFGGGTPSLLKAADFLALTGRIADTVGMRATAVVNVEVDPRTLTACKATAYAAAGVDRVSLGVQDFSPEVQSAINRVQPFSLVAHAVETLRAAGIERLSFDLMYGLPHQTVESVRASAVLAASLEPARLSVFGYAHVPHMKAHQRLIDEAALPGGSEREAQADAVAEVLTAAGYVRIGFDHYARPEDSMALAMAKGALTRNFQGYAEDACERLIGVGASAISSFPQGHTQNTPDVAAYEAALKEGRFATARGVASSPEDRLRAEVIRSLLCGFEADVGAIARAHGFDPRVFGADLGALGPLVADGLAVLDGAVVRIPPSARKLARVVAAVFDARRAAMEARFSAAI